jgi:hypothetical protein
MKTWHSMKFIFLITLLTLCGGVFEFRKIFVSDPVYMAIPIPHSEFLMIEPRISRFLTEHMTG